ncbi:hypothetical protein Q8W71_20585 [Methylobacterium sp. NEAU 140]|uniref:hypothetical protein n=1 Tax=Methylobacterium sp. NEAU 140 TaxID=3064945 RepID=UPI002737758A|nr:hypothetical protein [Methylobacterium sp. NEAU 140]MDP4025029.1 hypothetical protein [Methylobacterium sp. NEAU 140]
MGCVAVSNIVPFRRPPAAPPAGEREARNRRRGEQRSLMDAVYASGSLVVAAGDRDTKLTASRLQVYGFLAIEELSEDGTARRLRPSEAIRARAERPWRLSKPAMTTAVTIPSLDGFLFDALGQPG